MSDLVPSPAALTVPQSLLNFDLPVMIAVAGACLPAIFSCKLIARWEGAVFLANYAACTTYLLLAALRHDALSTFGFAMTAAVLPLTAITRNLSSTSPMMLLKRLGTHDRTPCCHRAEASMTPAYRLLIMLGCGVLLSAAAGLFRLNDAVSRQHSATKAGTLGLGLLLAGTALVRGD